MSSLDMDPVRRLKARVKQAESWIAGSGSHHRSKGGAHTSSARETHSAASGSKDKVRDRMAEGIEALIQAVEELTNAKDYRKLTTAAATVAKNVRQK